MMNIVLVAPEIPQNTGNIVRTCAVTGANLYLVKPLGFSISDRWLKRAGLDYWDQVKIKVVDDFTEITQNSGCRLFFYSSKATKIYSDAEYTPGDFLVFGSETKGLPEEFWDRWPENFYTIPKRKNTRCLNLANAVSIVLYEAWRQQSFAVT